MHNHDKGSISQKVYGGEKKECFPKTLDTYCSVSLIQNLIGIISEILASEGIKDSGYSRNIVLTFMRTLGIHQKRTYLFESQGHVRALVTTSPSIPLHSKSFKEQRIPKCQNDAQAPFVNIIFFFLDTAAPIPQSRHIHNILSQKNVTLALSITIHWICEGQGLTLAVQMDETGQSETPQLTTTHHGRPQERRSKRMFGMTYFWHVKAFNFKCFPMELYNLPVAMYPKFNEWVTNLTRHKKCKNVKG